MPRWNLKDGPEPWQDAHQPPASLPVEMPAVPEPPPLTLEYLRAMFARSKFGMGLIATLTATTTDNDASELHARIAGDDEMLEGLLELLVKHDWRPSRGGQITP